MEIKELILTDNVIEDPQHVSFILQCAGQVELEWVQASLSNKGVVELAKEVDFTINSLHEDESIAFDISTAQMKELCVAIVAALDEYEDTHTILGLTSEEAIQLINQI